MNRPSLSTAALRRDAHAMLELVGLMADLARHHFERLSESTDAPEHSDVSAADALDRAIEAISVARRSISESPVVPAVTDNAPAMLMKHPAEVGE